MPLYIVEGTSVFTQLNKTANRARELSNHFEVHAALEKKNN